jgi:acyl-CoA dehydrogenase
VPKSLWLRAGQEGLLNPLIPEPFGGGGDFGHSAVLLEEMARANATSVGFPLHSDIVAPYIYAYGNPEQRERWLPKMMRGEMIGAIAMTEPGTGSDLKAVRTNAVREGDHYVLNGQKTFITNGQNAGLVIVVAKTNPDLGAKGISLLVVEEGMPGFEKGRKLKKIGMRAQDTSELFFDNVRVPIDNLLGEENSGFKYLMHELAQERLVIAVRCAAS